MPDPQELRKLPILHVLPQLKKPAAAWEERMLRLKAKIDALTYRKINYTVVHSTEVGFHNPDIFQNSEDVKAEKIIFADITADTALRHATVYYLISYRLIRETSKPDGSGGNYRNSGTYYLIDSGVEVSILSSTSADQTFSNHPLILAAANDHPIKTYGQKSVTLDLGLRRTFR
ncbi:hypothetical protein ACTXT7_013830 [Hymenolepis weldensis]